MKRTLICAVLVVFVTGLLSSCTTVPRETPASTTTSSASHTYSK